MKENNPLVTIGIPFYNAEKFIKFAICSVINQSFENWELLLLDDGSADNSLAIASSFTDKRITVISDGVNKGLVYRLNQLIDIAKGKYFARMDADDIMHYDRIKIQVNYLVNHSEVDVVGSSYYSIDLNNEIIGKTNVNIRPDSVESILQSGCFAHPSIMGKRDWFVKNRYNEKWYRMEDFELWIRTVTFSNFRNVPEPLLFYRNIGIPTLKKYLKSNVGIILLLQKRKIYKITLLNSQKYSFIYILKILIYSFFFVIGKIDYLIKLRSINIKESEAIIANKVLLQSINKI